MTQAKGSATKSGTATESVARAEFVKIREKIAFLTGEFEKAMQDYDSATLVRADIAAALADVCKILDADWTDDEIESIVKTFAPLSIRDYWDTFRGIYLLPVSKNPPEDIDTWWPLAFRFGEKDPAKIRLRKLRFILSSETRKLMRGIQKWLSYAKLSEKKEIENCLFAGAGGMRKLAFFAKAKVAESGAAATDDATHGTPDANAAKPKSTLTVAQSAAFKAWRASPSGKNPGKTMLERFSAFKRWIDSDGWRHREAGNAMPFPRFKTLWESSARAERRACAKRP